MEATKRTPALALNLAGMPKTVSLQLEIWKLIAGDGVDPVLKILGDTYAEDSEDTTPQDTIPLSRFKRTYQDIHQIRAKLRLAPCTWWGTSDGYVTGRGRICSVDRGGDADAYTQKTGLDVGEDRTGTCMVSEL